MSTDAMLTYFRGFGVHAYRHDIGDYMHRWMLVLPGGWTVRLHHILRSDAGRDFHDHPFSFASLLLTGGYTEHTPAGWRHIQRWSLVRRRAEDLHRLELTEPIWTFVVAAPRRREWGFQTSAGWKHWTVYEEQA